jgi:hypothetical protein
MDALTRMVKIGAIEYSAQNEVADEIAALREKLAERVTMELAAGICRNMPMRSDWLDCAAILEAAAREGK